MARELQLARRAERQASVSQDARLPWTGPSPDQAGGLSSCEHRTVSKDGRIVCTKIVEGDSEVSPNVCRTCPFKSVDCAHLRFSLRQSSSAPLIVRHNGRTELWDDRPGELRFEHAACAVRVTPVVEPRSCAGCRLRQALRGEMEPVVPRRPLAGAGKVVPFPGREALAATG